MNNYGSSFVLDSNYDYQNNQKFSNRAYSV